MSTLIRRVLTVLVLLFAMMWTFQALLTRDGGNGPSASTDPPTRPVTIRQVQEANIPMPTRSRVSFPKFSYKQAEPNATDGPEYVIEKFDEAPMLKDLAGTRPEWRKFYPEKLPPVEERLPVNPAVVVGPDSPGEYGGIWRRCTAGRFDFYTKLCTESFMKNDPSGNLQPCLAYKWEASSDNRVYTLYLRKGHKWSDGQPFTTDDILWTCNTVIGSPIFEPPDWTQARDGAAFLYDDDVTNWPALAKRIIQEAASPPSVGRQIQALGAPRLWKTLKAMAAGESNDPDAPALAAADLSDLMRDANFHTAEAFRGVDANRELRALRAKGASRLDANELGQMLLSLERGDILRRKARDANSLTLMEVSRLNLLMFRSAYGDLVVPPAKDRVQVTAVPDETGDTSHIIRFTFRKPNSLFIEHTPTFMFYRILSGAKHVGAPLHPDGRNDLCDMDVFEWGDLFAAIQRQAGSPGPSAGRQVWAGLSDALQQKIQAGTPAKDSPDAYKNEVLGGLNAALASRAFYDANAFAAVNFQALRDHLLALRDAKDLAELFRDETAMLEFRDLLVLEDLRARASAEGAGRLSDAEVLRLNVGLFRAAFSGDAKKPLVARTRTEGLNEAANKHPLRYVSWSARYNDRGSYHPIHNPDPVVLSAWRIVSEKDAPEMLAVRNPYYYKVDAQGRQLPYIDAVQTTISDQKQIRILKMTSGNVDMQAREVMFDEFTVLKQNEKKGDYEVRLWANDYCGEVTFIPLQSHKDPMFLRLEEDPNFRYALSLALNRREMIDVVFAGLGEPAQFSIPEGSPYYSEAMAKQCVEYDPNRANRLLDAMGLNKRAADGTRLFWNGEPFTMDVNMPTSEMPDAAVRLVCQYWQSIGINAQMKIRTGNMMYRLQEMGECDISAHKEGGNFFGPFPPGSYYPSHQAESVQWYQWTMYQRSGGRSGWPAPERIKELERQWQKMVEAPNRETKMAGWKAITDRFARDLPIIGVMTSPGKIVYVKNGFMNVPKIAMAGWIAHEPGNACPECFYFGKDYKRP